MTVKRKWRQLNKKLTESPTRPILLCQRFLRSEMLISTQELVQWNLPGGWPRVPADEDVYLRLAAHGTDVDIDLACERAIFQLSDALLGEAE